MGIRIKLASIGSGKWEDSGGDVSKFGLTSSEVLEAMDFLEKNKMKDCLQACSFSYWQPGYQIRRIKIALREASQFYVQLLKMGFNVEFVDIGGGLGVDYDGTRSSNSESSVNYSLQEYVNDSICTLVDAAIRITFLIPILLPNQDVRLLPIIRCLFLKFLRPQPCRRGMMRRQ